VKEYFIDIKYSDIRNSTIAVDAFIWLFQNRAYNSMNKQDIFNDKKEEKHNSSPVKESDNFAFIKRRLDYLLVNKVKLIFVFDGCRSNSFKHKKSRKRNNPSGKD